MSFENTGEVLSQPMGWGELAQAHRNFYAVQRGELTEEAVNTALSHAQFMCNIEPLDEQFAQRQAELQADIDQFFNQ